MSVRHQSQDQIRSTYTPSGGNHLLLHRAVVASTSLLALSAALGWSDPALAAGTCGAPSGGVANCGNTNYPTGIQYTAGNGVDDLTVNVGSFAGQNAAVTVTGGITVENTASTSNSSQTVNVGSNVTISGLDGIEVGSQSTGTKAVDSIYSGASISALAGIYSVVSDQDATGNATGSGSITNTGNIEALIGIEQHLLVLGYSATHNEKVSATSTVSNTGKISAYSGIESVIQTQAISKVGIAAVAANSTVKNSGAIKTTGGLGYGVGSYVGATAQGALGVSMSAYSTIQNSGDIRTSGVSAAGVVALSRAIGVGAGSVTGISVAGVYNSGNVKTTGATAYTVTGGIKYYDHGADALVAASYMVALGSKGSQAVAQAVVNNSGALSTRGTGADGIYAGSEAVAASSYHYSDSATAYAIVKNKGSIKVSGAGADGIYASSHAIAGVDPAPSDAYYGTAKAVTSVKNSGAIKTSGGESYTAAGGVKTYHGADGIYASSYSLGGGVFGARSTATTYVGNSGPISTSGVGAAGIDAAAKAVGVSYYGFATGGAYVTVVNSGAISTKGAGATGILATSTAAAYGLATASAYAYSTATVENSGAIKTSGDYSDGIAAVSKGLAKGYFASVYTNATAINAGTITTKGAGSVGVFAYAASKASGLLSAPYANANAINTGRVKTKGAKAAGVVAASGTYSAGEFVYSAARSTITNTGSVTTSGVGAAGLYADSSSTAASPGTLAGDSNGKTYAGSTITNTGSVTTSGDGAIGAAALASAKSYSAYYSHAHSAASATNLGSITTKGAGAHGIVSKATATAVAPATSIYQSIAAASSTVLNAGSVSTSGAGANGIVGYTKAIADGTASGASATATTMVTNAGSVKSAQGTGILAYSAAYANSGSNASAKASSTVVNAGSVLASGPGGIGVFAASLAGTGAGPVASSATVVNAAGGSITASGTGGVGVKVEAAYATVSTYAGSTITGGKGTGAVGVYESGALNIISNAGSIGSGNDHAIDMEGIAANEIKNNGTITGYVTMHGTGPAEQNVFYNYGTWIARGGNSDFAHTAGGGSNLVNEDTGTIIVVGNQSFTNLDKFTNVGGLITMTQAASAGQGMRPAFETLTVSGDYEGIGGALAVDASTVGGMQGDVLNIKGEASGLTDVKATILGTPGPTTGNGILVVKAHSTAAAGSEFVLDGNANGGHSEVAGAFEYNLDFVPGAGTSGDWYLKSAVYPGVSQFGQVGSSTALISDEVNPEVLDLLNQVMDGEMKTASLDTSSQVASVDSSFVPSSNDPGGSAWGRFDEARLNVDPSGSAFSNYKLRVDSAQIGLDYDWHNAANAMLIGGYVTPFHAWSDFSTNGAHINTSGTAYGVYGLWFSGPWQAGLRLNMDSDTAFISDTNIGTRASTKPDEKGAQAAVSYDMPLDWGADFTPSAELNYAKIDGVNFTDGAGDPVQVGSTNDFWGKINGRLSTDVMTDKGLLVQPYVNIGLLYRGDTSSRVTVDDFSSATNVNGWNGDFAVGVNTNLATGLSLSAQADYIAGNRVDGWQGFIGLRYTPGAVEAPQPSPPPPMAPPPPPPPPAPTKTFIVFFDFNKSNLTAEAQSVVSEAVKTAKENGMVRVLVTGHTDTVGSDSYNMGLSVRRAQSVKDEMVRQGIDGSGISIEGKGFHDPLVPTGPGVREPQNRRAVIDLGG